MSFNLNKEEEKKHEEEAHFSPVTDGAPSHAEKRGRVKKPPDPGASKDGPRTRSRSGFASSRASLTSNASATAEAERKSRRELAHEANRLAAAAAREQPEENQIIVVPSSSEEEKDSPVREDYPRKRKLPAEEGTMDAPDGTRKAKAEHNREIH